MEKVNIILQGDVINRLKDIEDNTIQCVVTSPPYWGLRDYGEDKQLGLEETPEEYVENMVKVFREVKRALKDLKPINKVIHIKIPILQLKTQIHQKILLVFRGG